MLSKNLPFSSKSSLEKVRSFVWQHVLLLGSLYLMTLGVVLSIKSYLGSSVISSLPFVFSLAGEAGEAPALTVGDYTIIMNFILVGCQILVLRKRFELVQLFQLVIGFVFGWLIDLNMNILQPVECKSLFSKIFTQFMGCTVMGIGISFEIKCGSVTMPGEGISVAVSRVTGRPFAKVKMLIDTLLVVLAVLCSYLYFGEWKWNVIGPGTLFAMVYVGFVVKLVTPHIGWFDRLMSANIGWKYVVGLARFLKRN